LTHGLVNIILKNKWFAMERNLYRARGLFWCVKNEVSSWHWRVI